MYVDRRGVGVREVDLFDFVVFRVFLFHAGVRRAALVGLGLSLIRRDMWSCNISAKVHYDCHESPGCSFGAQRCFTKTRAIVFLLLMI